MSIPYMPLYVVDFEADTVHLSIEEDGAFNRLLRLCWRSPGCSIPDDPAWIKRQMRVDDETYERVVAPILAEFFKRRRGKLHSPRLTREFKKLEATFLKRSSAGQKGGRPPKPRKTNEMDESRDKARPKQPEPEPKEKVVAADAPALIMRVLSASGADRRPLTAYWTGPAAEIHVNRWRDDLGLSEDEVLRVVTAEAARHGEPASGPKAFDRAMRALAAEKQSAALVPFPTGGANGKPSREQEHAQRLQARLERARAFDLESQQQGNR